MVVTLPSKWVLWFHDPNDSENWQAASYRQITNIASVDDWCGIHHAFKDFWINGMFWIMREGFPPIWEDPLNRQGGCYSFKIMKPEVPDAWFKYVAQVLGETAAASDSEKITGIAITPKRNYCVLRIWIRHVSDAQSLKLALFIPSYTNTLFKAHLDKCTF
jgi:hypothetical protein